MSGPRWDTFPWPNFKEKSVIGTRLMKYSWSIMAENNFTWMYAIFMGNNSPHILICCSLCKWSREAFFSNFPSCPIVFPILPQPVGQDGIFKWFLKRQYNISWYKISWIYFKFQVCHWHCNKHARFRHAVFHSKDTVGLLP